MSWWHMLCYLECTAHHSIWYGTPYRRRYPVPCNSTTAKLVVHYCTPQYHHHHQITKLSHSINAIGPAPHLSGRKREHRSIVFATITHIPSSPLHCVCNITHIPSTPQYMKKQVPPSHLCSAGDVMAHTCHVGWSQDSLAALNGARVYENIQGKPNA
jgi:hypothetical protein